MAWATIATIICTSLPDIYFKPHTHWHPPTHTCCSDKHMHSSHCPCSRTYIKTTVWTSKIKLHLPVWDTLITLMSVGIQSKSKLCPTKMAPLISSPIKSISCPRAYFRQFISPVASSNRPYPGLPSQKVWCGVMCVCLECFTGAWCFCPRQPFPMIIQALPSTVTFANIHCWLNLLCPPWAELNGQSFQKIVALFAHFLKSLRSIVKLSCREAERNGTDVIHIHLSSLSQRWSCDSLTYKKSYLLIDRLIFKKNKNKNEMMSGIVFPLLHAASLM